MMPKTLVLFGSGPMAIEYSKVLDSLNMPYLVKGRGTESASSFFDAVGKQPIFEISIESSNKNNPVIIAVGEAELTSACLEALHLGFRKILVEKPGGINPDAVRLLADVANKFDAQIYVAFNRRFFQSSMRARSIIKEDGGATSISFDFSERSRLIENLSKAPGVKENWLFQNSCHVIDLAMFLSGGFREIHGLVEGGLTWHPLGSKFAGYGKTVHGAILAYSADWDAPGAWSIKIKTTEHVIELSPLEVCKATNRNGETVIYNELASQNDLFKPGIRSMVEEFLCENPGDTLMTLENHVETLWVYEKIAFATGRS